MIKIKNIAELIFLSVFFGKEYLGKIQNRKYNSNLRSILKIYPSEITN